MSTQPPPPSSPPPAQPTHRPPHRQDEQHLQLGHDQDPTDGYEPVPLWLLVLFGGLLAWGGWYLGAYTAGWRWLELDERSTGAAAASQPAEDPVALGQRIFRGNCVSCHQADGKGLPGQYPTLNGSEWVHGNPAWMKRIVLHGLEGPITVAGANYNNAMPALGTKLTDKQIAAVITFVRTNAQWGNHASAVLPEAVAATRQATKGRSVPFSASELQSIAADEGPAAPTTGAATTAATTKSATTGSTTSASSPAR